MAEKNRSAFNSPVLIPIHLRGADEIAEVFGVARAAVIGWLRDGAPIYLIGKKYQANYYELWYWIQKKRALPKTKHPKFMKLAK